MTITRNGRPIKLTADELRAAYYEQARLFDAEDVEIVLEEYEEDTDGAEAFFKAFGATIEQARAKKCDVAGLKRGFMDAGQTWRDAVESALRSVLKKEE